MPTVTQLTSKYISEHPSIKDCLAKGLINYSALSRDIKKSIKDAKKNATFDAILIATRRFADKNKHNRALEEGITSLLKKSEIEVKNKVVVVIIEKSVYPENIIELERAIKKNNDVFYLIEGSKQITLITTEKYLSDIDSLFKNRIIKKNVNKAIIDIKTSQKIENISGVLNYLTSLFAGNGVNIIECMSCWTDNLFVVSEEDISKVMGFLRF